VIEEGNDEIFRVNLGNFRERKISSPTLWR
jgi:hypothetical protein